MVVNELGRKRCILKNFARVIVASVLLCFAVSGYAQLPIRQNQSDLNRNAGAREIRNNPQANGKITERQAVNLARMRFAGNILRISLVGEGNSQRYQIRMENEGKVFTVFVNVATGRVTGGG